MNKIFLIMIVFYRNNISPHKGYVCAHHHLYGDGSCSFWAYEVIKTKGIMHFIRNFRHRLGQCQLAHEDLKESKKDDSGNKEDKPSDNCCIPYEISSCWFF